MKQIDKSTLLQEARAFNESPVNVKKCIQILEKLNILLLKTTLQEQESTLLFFSITKLFQCPDALLRQLVYLTIKELASTAKDVIMATSSFTKDMTAKQDLIYRPNSIRALCRITDPSMIQGIERFLKQSIVDRNPALSSAALVSCSLIFSQNKDVVRRWANEVTEAVNSKTLITQYHALGALYLIRQHDRMAVIKLIQTYARSAKSPHAICMLIRFCAKTMHEDPQVTASFYDYLSTFLRHRSDMVVYEACRAITNFAGASSEQLRPAISALQSMLSNHSTTLRFAAIRTLNQLALSNPSAVFPCNIDIEALITDSNRSIATFAITTLLKTGNEQSVDRLMTQISGFMNEISDEFKIIVVEAVRSLCLKFKEKYKTMIDFLMTLLRDEGGYEFKRSIVDAIFDIVHSIPDSKEQSMILLCEFLEDCDYSKLAVRILHLFGTEGRKTLEPSRYIRHIYNRIILETASVRAAAVSALAQFGINNPETRESIMVLLKRCTFDADDEVRDRAAMYLSFLQNSELTLLSQQESFSWTSLEYSLASYVNDPEQHGQAFDIDSIPVLSKDQELSMQLKSKDAAMEVATGLVRNATPVPVQEIKADIIETLMQVPQLAKLGAPMKSSLVNPLTEAETEYVVNCYKHLYKNHLVLQFEITNTMEEILLENVVVDLAPQDPIDGICLLETVSIPHLAFNQPESVLALKSASFQCTLSFIVKEANSVDDPGYSDEYQVEDLQIFVGDYIKPTFLGNEKWNELAHQDIETYQLPLQSIDEAVTKLHQQLGMKPTLDNNHHVMQGMLANHAIFCRVRMVFDKENGVTMELSVKSSNEEVCSLVSNGIQ